MYAKLRERPAFEVCRQSDGHVFRVYRDGRIEGFGGDQAGMVVLNRIPMMEQIAAEIACAPFAVPGA